MEDKVRAVDWGRREPTAWMRETTRARVLWALNLIESSPVLQLNFLSQGSVVTMSLTDAPEEEPGRSEWFRTCDRCWRVNEETEELYCGNVKYRHKDTDAELIVTFGLCRECTSKEVDITELEAMLASIEKKEQG